jgi:hypothetical protein
VWGVLVNALTVFGMLVIMPLGLRLIDGVGVVCRWWPVFALPGAVSLWLPRGGWAVAFASVYAVWTLVLAGGAARRLAVRRSLRPSEIAVLSALVAPSVAGMSLVAERAGYPLMGFELHILSLTVAHFHFAGFAAALIAGLVCVAERESALSNAGALSVPIGTGIVLIGYFVSEYVELLGAVVLTAGMWIVGWLLWTRALRLAAVTLAITMVLALSWAAGEAFGTPHLSIEWMAATHGVANAFGFALAALMAWRAGPAE